MKRILSIALVLIMCLSIMPNIVLADNNSGQCGDNLYWSIDDSGVMTISGTGDMWNFSVSSYGIGDMGMTKHYSSIPWSAYDDYTYHDVCTNVNTVIVEEGVTSLGSHVFYLNRGIVNVSLPSTLKKIESYAFYMGEFSEITLYDGLEQIGTCAFSGCKNLETVTLPSTVKSIGGYAFENCSSLNSINLSSSVEYIGDNIFYGCSKIDKDAVIEQIGRILKSFYKDNTELVNYEIPYGVNRIDDSAFEGCSNLTQVTIPETVTYIGVGAFKDCAALKEVLIPDSVVYIGDSAFKDCTELGRVTLSDNLIEFGANMFSGTPYLDNAVFSSVQDYNENHEWNDPSVGPVIEPLYGILNGKYLVTCSNRNIINIPDNVTVIADNLLKDGIVGNSNANIKQINFGKGVTVIPFRAFPYCWRIESINIPGNVKRICDFAFDGCGEMSNNPPVVLEDGVEYIGMSALPRSSKIVIPDSVSFMGANAVPEGSVVYCNINSYVYKWCAENNRNCFVYGQWDSEPLERAAEQGWIGPYNCVNSLIVNNETNLIAFAKTMGLETHEADRDINYQERYGLNGLYGPVLEYADSMVESGLLVPGDYQDGNMNLYRDANRGDSFLFLCRALGLVEEAKEAEANIGNIEPVCSDWYALEDWLKCYVKVLFDHGLLTGDENGNVNAESSLTAGELAVMLCRYTDSK